MDLKELDRKLEILTEIQDIFRNGTHEERIETLSALGSNLTIESKSVRISTDVLYETIKKGLLKARAKNQQFEPEKTKADKDETDVFASVRPTMLAWQGSFRTWNWAEIYPDPDYVLKQVHGLLVVA